MRFGLALSGGALRGAAHIGVLKALEEYGYFPSWISGASAGSIVAGLYSIGYTPAEMEAIAVSLKRNIFDLDYSGILLGLASWLLFRKELNIDGVIKGSSIEKLMKELAGNYNIKETKIPLAITSVNINNGQTVIFVSNKKRLKSTKYTQYVDDVTIRSAIRASVAIPVIFKPHMIHGMRLVDGGVSEGLPVSVLKEMGASRVIGVNLGYSGQMKKEIDNIIEIGNQAIDIMSYQITRLRTATADCIINPCIYDVGLMDIEKIPECIQRGYESVSNNIDLIKKALKN